MVFEYMYFTSYVYHAMVLNVSFCLPTRRTLTAKVQAPWVGRPP